MIAAVVPAAGRSTRVGHPKLLVKLSGETLIARVVRALLDGGAQRVVVIVPPADAIEGPALAAAAGQAGAEVIVPPLRPAEMRQSIELGLETLSRPTPPERVLLAPGDHPGVTRQLVARLLECAREWPQRIVVPCSGGRRGHPIVLPWGIAAEVRGLPHELGVNALVARHEDRVFELTVSSPEAIADLDTPEDFQQWSERRADGGDQGTTRVMVRLFALAKERAGCSELDLELPSTATVADLRAALGMRVPPIAPLMSKALIAVNEEYADDDARIAPGSRIAVIPPVSGGVCGAGRWPAPDRSAGEIRRRRTPQKEFAQPRTSPFLRRPYRP
jgi:molybdenum cofactor cytidylyltransferase